MRARLVSLLVRPTAPPMWLGLVVGASFIAAESALILALKQTAPGDAFGVVFLLGVLITSTVWGFGVAAITSVVSAMAFDYCRMWPEEFDPTAGRIAFKPAPSPAMEAARQAPPVAAFLNFSQYHLWSVSPLDHPEGAHDVGVQDGRFPFGAEAVVDSSNRVISSSFHY